MGRALPLLSFVWLFSWFSAPLSLLAESTVQSFQAEFNQTISSENSRITHQGIIYGKFPDHLRWSYHQPITKEIYIHDDQVVIIEPILEQVTLQRLSGEIDFFTLLKRALDEERAEFVLTIRENTYRIAKKEGVLQQITFQDELGNDVAITFNHVIIDTILDDDLFQYVVPKSYDLIRK